MSFLNLRFENDVKMYGTQAIHLADACCWSFENDVKMYGTQATRKCSYKVAVFENDVKMYGTQAAFSRPLLPACLRMM